MNYAQEIVIDSDDGDVIFSDEEFQEEANVKIETMDYTIEAIDKTAAMEIEEKIPYDTKVIRNRNKKSRLIEELMIEEMDIQNEQYVLKKVKPSQKDKGKGTPQDPVEINKGTNLSELESEILQSDVPERLQYLYGSRPRKVPQEELEVEAKWIARRLERKKKMNLDNDPDPLVSQVFTALDLIKNQYYEVMYIYTYKFNEILDLTLDDLWFIQNRDSEWIQMSKKKAKLIKESEEKITHELSQSYIEDLIINTFDEYTLENISGYIQYKELTLNPANSTLQLPVIAGLNMHDLYSNKELKEGLSACVADIFLTPEDFAFNLKHNNLVRVPKPMHQRPGDYYKSKKGLLQGEGENKFTGNMMSFFQTVTFLMAYELYFHPLVKAFARRIYHEKVKISTRPKPAPEDDVTTKIDIYEPDYLVKRIKNRPFTQFKADETGIYLLKNATEGKIDMCFHTSDEIINIFDLNALSPDKDGMLKHLVRHFILQESDDQCTSEWNLIRKECINFLVHHLLYPHLQKELEKDILETSEKAVINSCGDRLKYIINNGPCLSPQEEKSYSNVVSIVLTEEKQILAVAIDRDGFYQDSSPKFNFDPFKMMNSQQVISNVDSSKKEEYHTLGEFIFRYRPELIVLGDYKISRRVIRKIVRDYEDTPYSEDLSRNIIYSSTEIPKSLLDAPKNLIWNQAEYPDIDQDQRTAVYLGRMQQDALCEVTKLWSNQLEENQLLKVLSHDLQAYVNSQKLMQRYEEVLIETVNRNGVDLNQMLQCTHRSSPLQFVCGLGPIKAQYFIGITIEKQTKIIKQRNFIFRYEKGCFQDKIFWNSSGFIKITPPKGEAFSDEYKPLDQTRIHPSWYGLAKKIEKDTFEEIPESLNNVLDKAARYPDLLKEVDIDDFATHLEQSKGMKNMKPVLEFIISELINPFKGYRRQFGEWNQEYLYFKMTGLNSFYCQLGSMVQGVITKLEKTFVNVRLETGIECAVYKYEVFDKDISSDLTKEFYEGQNIVARIVNLNYEHFKTDFSSLVKINLSLKPGVLNNHKSYILAIHPSLDEYNIIDPNDDYPVLISNKRKKTNFIDRMIMHNKFKNITADEAIDLLDEKDLGEVLFRPGKRTDQIYITWKFYDHMYIHVEIHEGPKLPHEPLSKKLTINKKTFSSLNEIIAHYITPCNKFVKTVAQHAKFFRGDVNTIRQQLQMEKEAEPKYIPYHILFSKDAPQHALLCYLKNSMLETEYIKIDGSGYWFHDALFIVFEELIRYFKMNQSKPDYINYVHSSKKPFVEVIPDDDEEALPSSSINSGFGIETIKWKDMNKVTLEDIDKVPDLDSIKVKQEKRPPMLCENCGVRGHQANQCPVSNDRPRRSEFGNKRGGWNNQDENSGTGSAGKGWSNSGSQSAQKGWGQDSQPQDWGAPAGDDMWASGEAKEKMSTEKTTQGGWGKSSSWENNTSSWGTSSENKEGWGSSGGQNKWGSSEAEKESGSTGWGSNSWGGGRRDDSDQKPRSKGCFKCGEEGHMARDCPNPRKDDRDSDQKPRSRACFKCGEEGHMSRECPNPRKEGGESDQKPRSRACFKCGEEGHMSRDCPNPGEKPRKMTCFRCGEEGHSAKGCNNPRKEGADPRGSWKPRDSNDESSDRPTRGWGSNSGSGSGWGSSVNASESWSGQVTDTWGSGTNKSQENKSTDSWGVQKGDTWGSQEKKDKMEVENSWGSGGGGDWGNSSKPETKATTGDTWGVSGGWGGFAKPEPKNTVADSWGTASAGSWGDSNKSEAKATGDTWGAPAVSAWGESSKPEQKPAASGDSWGSASAGNDSWGKSSTMEVKATTHNTGDSWGQKEAKPASPEKSWSAKDTWGEPSKTEAKMTGDLWGAPAATNEDSSKPKDSWGAPAASSWGETSKPETKPNEGSSWGTSGGWGETSKGETKSAETASWGASGGSTWGDSVQKNKTDNSWGNSGWGESKNDAWGTSGTSSWGDKSNDKAESGWGKSGTSSWGGSGNDSGNGNNERKSSWQGGRRDDGDRPRSKGCFKCGEEGHMARDCPNPRKEGGDGDQRPRSRACFKCGEEGHMSRECPNPRKEGGDDQKPRNRGCFKCGGEGHMSRDCPNPGEKPRKLTCFRCGEEGHGARGCNNPRKEGADPRGSWKPRDSNNNDSDRPSSGWGRKNGSRSRSRSRERERERTNSGGWGNKSGEKGDSGWGKSSTDWGKSDSNDTWGSSAGWGKTSSNDTWGNAQGNDSAKKNDTWGSAQGNDSGKKNDTWGSAQGNDSSKKTDTWGASNDAWGNKDQTSKSDTWGASNASNDNKGGWGTAASETKVNSGDTWGNTTVQTSKNDSWGASNNENQGGWGTATPVEKSNSGGWGDSTSKVDKPKSPAKDWGFGSENKKDDWAVSEEKKGEWGTTAPEEKNKSGDTWENKPDQTSKNDNWGASEEKKGEWGTTAPEEKGNNDGWEDRTAKDDKPKSPAKDWGFGSENKKDDWAVSEENKAEQGASMSEEKGNNDECADSTARDDKPKSPVKDTTEENNNSVWGTSNLENKADNEDNNKMQEEPNEEEEEGQIGAVEENKAELGASISEEKGNNDEGEDHTVKDDQPKSPVKDTEENNKGDWGASDSQNNADNEPATKEDNNKMQEEPSEEEGQIGTWEENKAELTASISEEKGNNDDWEDNTAKDDKPKSPIKDTEENNNGGFGTSNLENKPDNEVNNKMQEEPSEEEEGQIGTWDIEKEEKSSKADEGERGSNNIDAQSQKEQMNEDHEDHEDLDGGLDWDE